MSTAYYGVIIPSSLFITRQALSFFQCELEMDYEKEQLDLIRDYKEWTREKLLREYIKGITNMPKYKEKVKISEFMSELHLESILLSKFFKYVEFNEIPTHLISNGEYIFAGWPIDTDNTLLPISKSISKEYITGLREELNLWNFNDFEIDFYSGPQLNLTTKVQEETKDRLI